MFVGGRLEINIPKDYHSNPAEAPPKEERPNFDYEVKGRVGIFLGTRIIEDQ